MIAWALAMVLSQACPGAQTAPPAGSCHYGENGEADEKCTPGSTQTDDPEIICHQSTKQRRCNFDKAFRSRLLKAYGVDKACEFDHMISLELGGDNSAANIWPQTVGCKNKDWLENALHRAYCSGKISLDAARAAVKNWDWRGKNGEWQTWAREPGK